MNKVLWIGLWCCGIVYVCWLAYVRLKRKKYTRFGSGEMFDSMAHYYDGMNRVISLVSKYSPALCVYMSLNSLTHTHTHTYININIYDI